MNTREKMKQTIINLIQIAKETKQYLFIEFAFRLCYEYNRICEVDSEIIMVEDSDLDSTLVVDDNDIDISVLFDTEKLEKEKRSWKL